MARRCLFLVLALCLPAATAAAERVVLTPPGSRGKAVELFVERSAATGPRPAILLVHGHQVGERPGARAYVDSGRLARLADQGYVAAAVSQPGYGGSDGPPDFCGPATQAAIRAALGHLRGLEAVDPERLVLYGVSRGAIAGAMVATVEPALHAAVLVAGIYDLRAGFPTGLPRMDDNIAREAGLSLAGFSLRSALHHVGRYRVPTLLLHGRDDDRAPLRQAEALAAALRKRQVAVELKVFETGHRIPEAEQWAAIEAFLSRRQ